MIHQVLAAVGGLALFLLGLLVLTEGLRQFAGDALHRALFRFTKSPTSGAVTGALVTAVLQSSSVTTVATVGLVSAGALAFPQALGILFGANVGTTLTSWMVALLGFELDIEQIVQPLLMLGVLLRLFGRGHWAHMGWALAGFALIFMGLDAMQTGMAGFEGRITPANFPDDSYLGRALLVGIGIVLTLVTQSSSAGMAMALTALDGGAISLAQGAAMVIGMDVGTTSTTAIATIGRSAATRRTGYSHVVYNLMTGVAAYFLLEPYLWAIDHLVPGGALAHGPLVLVGFHTAFNALGLIVVLPFTRQFARLMSRLVPESDASSDPSDRLDPRLARESTVAAMTLLGVVRDLSADLFEALARALDGKSKPLVDPDRLERVGRGLTGARHFADEIVGVEMSADAQRYFLSSMHVIDHLDRLAERCLDRERLGTLRQDERLRELSSVEVRALQSSAKAMRAGDKAAGELQLVDARDQIRAERHPYRERMLATIPDPEVEFDQVIRRLDALRWLHRTTYHAWRITHHLAAAEQPGQPGVDPGSEVSRPPGSAENTA
ncbi:Na/Pi cotransporter family protein [Engelhardtia mirabilis]|uniref:Na+/Pi-cotransporter n=1 Tax=Engelhardtia mirabilis TaxID=2528011 RepID=A0A518BEB7_9BACT|nr:Na+/Pi-cotransporter [Planctomycetes bacterium Pla133]QDU99647.1 Na+/Pi-cotransporter [Planctomycetes bacterium Pla86]